MECLDGKVFLEKTRASSSSLALECDDTTALGARFEPSRPTLSHTIIPCLSISTIPTLIFCGADYFTFMEKAKIRGDWFPSCMKN